MFNVSVLLLPKLAASMSLGTVGLEKVEVAFTYNYKPGSKASQITPFHVQNPAGPLFRQLSRSKVLSDRLLRLVLRLPPPLTVGWFPRTH